jgi:hypothetical protein
MKIFRVCIVILAVALLAFAGCEKGQMTGQEGGEHCCSDWSRGR